MVTIAQMHESLSLAVWNPVVTNLLVGGFLLISIAMILLVLIQRPQGGGLSGAFGAGGGGGAGQTAFGTKTGDVLTWATITIFVCFLLMAIVLNFATRPHTAAANPPIATSPQGAAPTDETTGEPVQDQAGDENAAEGEGGNQDAAPTSSQEQPAQEQPTGETPASDPPAELPADQPPEGDL